jgi:ribosome recycling factor
MTKQILDELESDFDKVIKDLKRSLNKVRTGRANLSMLDGITVEYYGDYVPINQVANLQVADARLITIQPWEEDMIPKIEKAIMKSDLGLNPNDDGTVIRVPIPALSEERREELVEVVNEEGEEHKIVLRNSRREARDEIEELESDSEISQDQMHRALEEIDDLTDEYTEKIDSILEDKKSKIREV